MKANVYMLGEDGFRNVGVVEEKNGKLSAKGDFTLTTVLDHNRGLGLADVVKKYENSSYIRFELI